MTFETMDSESSSVATFTVTDEKTFKGSPVSVSATVSVIGGKPKQVTIQHWAACLYRDPEDDGDWLICEIVGIPGVISQGKTRQEAMENAKEALACALEELIEAGVKVELRRDYVIPAGGEVVNLAIR